VVLHASSGGGGPLAVTTEKSAASAHFCASQSAAPMKTDLFSDLKTRVVVLLLPHAQAKKLPRLNAIYRMQF
jgi:hypothetical protein